MRREVSLEEISDGRLYNDNDMVRADCHGCAGCSDCCRGMGDTVLLDPYDAFRLTNGLQRPFADFIGQEIALSVVDGCVLPHLCMTGEGGACAFLDQAGRCSIHPFRPGICRLFPLGRYYDKGEYRYFLQTKECKAVRSKIKVSRWIDAPEEKWYREFVTDWHYLLNELEQLMMHRRDDAFATTINTELLKRFYFTPYETTSDFYHQFAMRKEQINAFTS